MRRIREIFEACLLEDSDDQREQLLARCCSGDGALEASVRQLLEAQAMGNTFLEQPLVCLLDGNDPPSGTATKTNNADENLNFDVGSELPTIGPYKLREQIGEGGFGLVYAAEQEEPVRRTVAIKVIKPGMDTRQVIARFEAERQALAMLDHPHIAKIFDGGTTDQGRPYFVMELVPGTPITEFCDQADMTIEQRIQQFLAVCSAIQHAHQKGIIHRDLKPSNVLVTMRDDVPVVKVIDFGVAKAVNQKLTEKTIYTAMGQMIGTPLYMSPEQAQMNDADIDTRSDIYSLGVLLYELLTGTTPFDHDTLKQVGIDRLRQMICDTDPPRPSSRISTLAAGATRTIADRRKIDLRRLKADLHGELDWIVMKAMEKNRSRRYQTVSELAADLRRYLNDEPVQACPPSMIYRFQKLARKHKGVLTTFVVVLLTMLIGIVLTSRQAFIANREAVRANSAELEAKQAQGRAETAALTSANLAALADQRAQDAILAAEKEAEQRMLAEQATQRESEQRSRAEQALYLADIRLAADRIDENLHSEAMDLLLKHFPVSDQPDRRSWEWYYLIGNASKSRLEWQAHESDGSAIDWSPDGSRIATVGLENTLKIWDANTGNEIKSIKLGKTILCGVAWSPSGKQLAWSSASNEARLYIWDSDTDQIETLDAETESVWDIMWGASGDRILISGMQEETNPQYNIAIWERNQGIWEIRKRAKLSANVNSARWDPKEERISVCEINKGFQILDGGSLETIIEIPGLRSAESVDWNPVSNLLVVGMQGRYCVVLDTESNQEIRRFPAHLGSVDHVEWSSHGDRLATCGSDGLIKIWNSADWSLLQTFSGHSGRVKHLTWNPDDTQVASIGSDGLVFVWETAQDNPTSNLLSLTSPGGVFSWTEDNLIRSVTDRTSITDRDPRTGSVRRTISLPSPDNWILMDRNVVADRDCNNPINRGEVWLISRDRELLSSKARLQTSTRSLAALSPDGRDLVLLEQWIRAQPKLLAVDGKYQRLLGDETFHQVWQTCWSPDGTRIALAGKGLRSDDGTSAHRGWVHVIDPETGKIVRRTMVGSSRIGATAVAWSADGSRLAAGNTDGDCQVMEGESLKTVLRKKLHLGKVDSIAWHPQANRIASGGEDGLVKIWESTSGEVFLVFPMERAVNHVEWSPDGSMLAASDEAGNIRIWDSSLGEAMNETSRFTARLENQRRLELRAIRHNAFALYSQGHYKDAVDEFRRAVDSSPDSATEHLNLASALEKAGDPEQAYRHYLRSVELDSNYAIAHNNLGSFLANQGRREESIEFFQRAIAIDPSDPRFPSHLGSVYAVMGRYQDAVDALQHALQLDPKNLGDLSKLVLAQLLTEDFAGYRATCQQIVDAFGKTDDDEEAWRVVWSCALADDAVAEFESLLTLAGGTAERHADSHVHQVTYGAILMRSGKLTEAVSALERALNVPSDGVLSPAYARYLLAMTHWNLEHRESAQTELQEANRLAAEEMDASPAWNRKETLLLLRSQVEALILHGEDSPLITSEPK